MLAVVILSRAYWEQGLWLAFYNFSLVLGRKSFLSSTPHSSHVRTSENKKVRAGAGPIPPPMDLCLASPRVTLGLWAPLGSRASLGSG